MTNIDFLTMKDTERGHESQSTQRKGNNWWHGPLKHRSGLQIRKKNLLNEQ